MISTIKEVLRYKMVLVCVLILSAFIVMGLFANFIAPYDPLATNLSQSCQSPSLSHPFGTDELGRDILSRVIYGARLTLAIAFAATIVSGAVGIVGGVFSGFYGGAVDMVFQRLTDILLALPGLLLAIMFIAIMGNNLTTVIVSVSLSMIPSYIRMAKRVDVAGEGTGICLGSKTTRRQKYESNDETHYSKYFSHTDRPSDFESWNHNSFCFRPWFLRHRYSTAPARMGDDAGYGKCVYVLCAPHNYFPRTCRISCSIFIQQDWRQNR